MMLYDHLESSLFMRVLLVSAIFLVPCLLPGQSTGTILGAVEDATGAVVPAAAVTVTNQSTSQQWNAVSDANGRFSFPRLPVGDYRLAATHDGFRQFLSEGIHLDADQSRAANIVLEVGQTSDRVTVTGAVGLVETLGATLKEVVDEKRISDLPLNGRNPLVPNPDALEEFSILTNNYSAEYGRNTGAVVNAITKSGTNQFHGALFEFVRNDAFDARNFFSLQQPKLRRNQFGGTLGGPIRIPHVYNGHDRTFFFFSYEGVRDRRANTFSSLVVPTQLERTGDFSQSARKPTDPQTKAPFPGSLIPATRFDPAAANFIKEMTCPIRRANSTAQRSGVVMAVGLQYMCHLGSSQWVTSNPVVQGRRAAE